MSAASVIVVQFTSINGTPRSEEFEGDDWFRNNGDFVIVRDRDVVAAIPVANVLWLRKETRGQ